MNTHIDLSDPGTLALLIPIVALCIPIAAIVMGGLVKIVQIVIRHRERIALIRAGIHPDWPSPPEPDKP